MANLPEKNITTVDKITSIPSNTNLYINANGEFRQATIDDVLKASPVIADSITNQYKNASGSPILLTDSAKGVVIDFDVKGRSTQDGEPTPTEPITPKSVGDMGYFDGELLQGYYDSTNGVHTNNGVYVCSKNQIRCNGGDTIKLTYGSTARIINFVFFDENGVFLSNASATNTTAGFVTAPTNASYFVFNINESTTSALTPQTTKHICVTINDKYALIVDSKGKNELENTATTQTINGVTFTVNEDKSVTVNGTATATCIFYINANMNIDVGEYSLNGCASGGSTSTYKMDILNSDGSIRSVDIGGGVRFGVTIPFVSQGARIVVYSGITVSNLIFYPMLRKAEITNATYEPYKKSRKYIPISAPLRGIGEVTDVASLSECKVDRKFIKVVFDGSKDESWGAFSTVGVFSMRLTDSKPAWQSSICSHFTNVNGAWATTSIVGAYSDHPEQPVKYFKTGFETLGEWKAWLADNPITVIYELAEPTNESIEPIEIVTYDNVTHISASDNAEMEVEYPTSKVAGIASIGWSKGRRAEYDLEQLKAQMLALQTTIVSTV